MKKNLPFCCLFIPALMLFNPANSAVLSCKAERYDKFDKRQLTDAVVATIKIGKETLVDTTELNWRATDTSYIRSDPMQSVMDNHAPFDFFVISRETGEYTRQEYSYSVWGQGAIMSNVDVSGKIASWINFYTEFGRCSVRKVKQKF